MFEFFKANKWWILLAFLSLLIGLMLTLWCTMRSEKKIIDAIIDEIRKNRQQQI